MSEAKKKEKRQPKICKNLVLNRDGVYIDIMKIKADNKKASNNE